jgi:hypothetical protein
MLVDTSTSMEVMGYEEILAGCNEFLDGQRKNDEELGSVSKFYLGTFATNYVMRYNGLSLNSIKSITRSDIPIYGMTAMYDGINGFINDISEGLEEGDKVIIFILTDGHENSSKEMVGEKGREFVFKKIKEKEGMGWKFYYAGANQDAMQVGGSLGIDPNSCISYDYSSGGVSNVMRSCSAAVSRNRTDGDSNFNESERSCSMVPDLVSSDDE